MAHAPDQPHAFEVLGYPSPNALPPPPPRIPHWLFYMCCRRMRLYGLWRARGLICPHSGEINTRRRREKAGTCSTAETLGISSKTGTVSTSPRTLRATAAFCAPSPISDVDVYEMAGLRQMVDNAHKLLTAASFREISEKFQSTLPGGRL